MADPTPQELLEEMFPPTRLTIGGLDWVEANPDNTTIERDVYIMTKARAANLDGFRADVDFESAPEVEAILREILGRILDSGMFFDMLSGLLVIDGEEWSPQGAVKAKEVFRSVKDKETKDKMLHACAKLVLGFFIGAVGASTPSRKSSGRRRGPTAVKPASTEVESPLPEAPVAAV